MYEVDWYLGLALFAETREAGAGVGQVCGSSKELEQDGKEAERLR
jgi:hypothetical protein